MDVIWVPDVAPGANAGKVDGQPLPPAFVLFLCGFVLLAVGAFMGTSWMIDGMAAGKQRGFFSAVGLLAIVPVVGFVFQNVAALIGTLKSRAPVSKRFIWFLVTQTVACGLLELSSLGRAL